MECEKNNDSRGMACKNSSLTCYCVPVLRHNPASQIVTKARPFAPMPGKSQRWQPICALLTSPSSPQILLGKKNMFQSVHPTLKSSLRCELVHCLVLIYLKIKRHISMPAQIAVLTNRKQLTRGFFPFNPSCPC